ncbi:hypothetical protein [Streptomyces sp. NPDC060031]
MLIPIPRDPHTEVVYGDPGAAVFEVRLAECLADPEGPEFCVLVPS